MLRCKKWIAPVTSLVLMLGLHQTQAQDKPTPVEGKATVTVTVIDGAGKPVTGAMVSIVAGRPQGKSKAATTQPGGQAQGARPVPLQTGTTGEDGTVALTKIPDGAYSVTAHLKGQGTGRGKVVVADGKDGTVSVTLKQRMAKPTTAN